MDRWVPGGSTADEAPGRTWPLPQSRYKRRRRRYVKRAMITLVSILVTLALAMGVLFVITPSAGQATKIARAQAISHGIAYPGPVVPANFTRPLTATEDHRFYSEPGVDIFAVGRVVEGKLTGKPDQGGATLEQQLAKLLYTPGNTGFLTEIEQVVLAIKLNYTYSKAEILRLYAEVAYYGHGYYGLEAASCGYFGHPASQLTVVQGAMLAGVVNAPTVDDPIDFPAQAHARLAHVIGRMVAVGDLTQAQGTAVLNSSLGIVPRADASC
jgi:membrane carboxypeptidase/penicillin-binding protein